MKQSRVLIVIILFFCVLTQVKAQTISLDSLVQTLQTSIHDKRSVIEIGALDLQGYMVATSQCTQQGVASHLIPHLLPFNSNPDRKIGMEAFIQAKYQWPGEIHYQVRALHATSPRTGRKVTKEMFRGLLPIYAIRRLYDDGSNKSYILPFYDEGKRRYTYQFSELTDSILIEAQAHGIELDFNRVCCISFHPIRRHHTLLEGYVLVDSVDSKILGLRWKGKLDMARFTGQLYFAPDTLHKGQLRPHCSEIDISYTYGKTQAENRYYTLFNKFNYVPLDSLDRRKIPHDLTPYYQQQEIQEIDFEQLRPIDLPERIDSLFSHSTPTQTTRHRKKKAIETFSETLVDGSRLGSEQNRLRIDGPLDPASLGYDKFNGFTIRERARWTRRFQNDRELYVKGEIGYAFRLRELRYRALLEWTYLPKQRGRWHIEVNRNNSTFSSKFINQVNDELQKEHNAIQFDSLGIEYYKLREFTLEHGIEASNGLMIYTGFLGNYRTPVKSGAHKVSDERLRELVDTYYADFTPFLRIEWTPNQFYRFDRGYKEYISSPAPTLSLEIVRAIPGVFNTDSNYGRIEFDASQSFRWSRTGTFAYHFGMGKFFNRKGEYFINYRYFNRSQYPTSWEDDRIGGTFHLLDDPWYSSSPAYVQSHFMQETPFGLLHLISPISRYIIKERIYLGSLWAEGKQFYNELGYGIDNNYFNMGFFIGFRDARYYSCGFKFRIELGRHL